MSDSQRINYLQQCIKEQMTSKDLIRALCSPSSFITSVLDNAPMIGQYKPIEAAAIRSSYIWDPIKASMDLLIVVYDISLYHPEILEAFLSALDKSGLINVRKEVFGD